MFDDPALRNKITLRTEAPYPVTVPQTDLPEQFVVLSIIGSGGMGTVYKCKNKYTDRIVAIKVLHDTKADEQATRRFQLEAKAASALVHENAVTVYDFGITAGGSPYLVMEYLRGETLAEIIKEYGVLPEEFVAGVMTAACSALQAAHEKGIIHRDIKPSNLMLVAGKNEDLVLKVLDFGIAKILDRKQEQNITKTGEIFGTPLYMSPEQCAGGSTDLRSDIFSLGACAYECLAGEPPHVGDNALQTMFKRASEDAPPLSKSRPDAKVSPDFERVVMKTLKRVPAERYQSMSELRSEFEKFATKSYSSQGAQKQDSRSSSAASPTTLPAASSKEINKSQKSFRPLVLPVVLSFVSIVLAALLFIQSQRQQPQSVKATAAAAGSETVSPSQPPRVKVAALTKEGLTALKARKYTLADAKFREAIAINESINEAGQSQLNLWQWLGEADIGAGYFTEAVGVTRIALGLANQLHQPEKAAMMTVRLGTTLVYTRQLEQAIPILNDGLEQSTKLDNKILMMLARESLSFSYLDLGQFDNCKRVCIANLAAITPSTISDKAFYEANAYLRLGKCAIAEKRYEAARQNCEKAKMLYKTLDADVGKYGLILCEESFKQISAAR